LHINDFYKSIAFEGVVNDKRKLNKILRLASFEPDFSYERDQDKKGRTFFDRYKFLGSGFGVWVHGYRHMRTNKEGKRVEKHVVSDWGVFAQGHRDNLVAHTYVDTGHDQLTYCFVEDLCSFNAFEFRLNNTMEVMDGYRRLSDYNAVTNFEKSIQKVNVAMLMASATVILPVIKETDDAIIKSRAKEEAEQKDLMSRARLGDDEAEEFLQNIAIQQEIDLRQRLANEDLLSIFEGYFLNLEEQTGTFSILADIMEVEELTNEASMQPLYRLALSIIGTKITAYINKNDLVGAPTAGMRLMGVGLMQGNMILQGIKNRGHNPHD